MNNRKLINLPNSLPSGWICKSLGEIADISSGGTPSRAKPEFWNGPIPWVKITDIPQDGIISITAESITELGIASSSAKIFPKGTILFSIFATIGKVGLLEIDAATNQAICGITPFEGVNTKYLFYFLRFSGKKLEEEVHGITQNNINTTILKKHTVVIPPLPEQQRIVKKIDDLLVQNREANNSIQQIPLLFETIRQAVLARAVKGQLLKHPSSNDDAESYLKRIIIEAKNSVPSKNYEKYQSKMNTELPELPSNWKWIPAGHLITEARYGTSVKCSNDPNGEPVLRIPNVVNGSIDLTDLKYGPLTPEEKTRLQVQKGDLLVVRTNGSLNLVGKSAVIFEPLRRFAFASYLIRLRPITSDTLPEYLQIVLSSNIGRKIIEGSARSTAGQHNVNIAALMSIPIPLPPYEEMRQIVKDVNDLLLELSKIDLRVDNARRSITRVEQAIFYEAFRGALVTQNANDVPAEIRNAIKTKSQKRKSEKNINLASEQGVTDIKSILRKLGEATVTQVFKASGKNPEEFWDELAVAIGSGQIQEVRKGESVYLRAKT